MCVCVCYIILHLTDNPVALALFTMMMTPVPIPPTLGALLHVLTSDVTDHWSEEPPGHRRLLNVGVGGSSGLDRLLCLSVRML